MNKNTLSSSPLSDGPVFSASEETQKSSHAQLFIFLWITILFAVGLGGVLFGKYLSAPKTSPVAPVMTPTQAPIATSTLDPTASWKTYTNTEYGFSLRFPLDWRVEQKYLDSNFKSQVFSEKTKYYLELTSTNESTSIQILPEGELDTGLEDTVEGKAELNGITVTTYAYQNGLVMFTNFKRQNLPYFRIQVKPKDNQVDHILSTFKFLDTESLLWPAGSQTPAAGVCGGPFNEEFVSITINADTANPRCAKVLPTQKLRLVNNTDKTITASIARFSATIEAGQDYTVSEAFGLFLAPGVHSVFSSPYGGPEIWLED